MDPFTQATLGAAAAQNLSLNFDKRQRRAAILLGIAGGMAPDLDVFIRSSSDPLLFLEYHRHFTHSLLFIPIGGLLTGIILYRLIAMAAGLSVKQSIGFATAGYATHALLDACTSYGTQLFWPFSDIRIAWNNISVVDPLYTLPLILVIALAFLRNKRWLARAALCWIILYPSIGLVQRDRVEAASRELAEERGHQPERLEAKPGFGTLLLWKVVYLTDGRFYVDAFRAGRNIRIYPGSSIPRLSMPRDLPWLTTGERQYHDVGRFNWFSDGFLAMDPTVPYRIIDIRYSMVPNEIEALWSVQLDPAKPERHAAYLTHRNRSPETMARFKAMLLGQDLSLSAPR